jgi:hypothetical protein
LSLSESPEPRLERLEAYADSLLARSRELGADKDEFWGAVAALMALAAERLNRATEIANEVSASLAP